MRLQFRDAETEQIWSHRINSIRKMVQDLELKTVSMGLRTGALMSATPGVWIPKDLYATPIDVGKLEDYSNARVVPNPDDKVLFRMLVTLDPQPIPNDDDEWGKLLGYPDCCVEFFKKNWYKTHDTTILQVGKVHLQNIGILANVFQNVTLKHLGIRPVFHLPCSYSCEKTAQIARMHREITNDPDAWGWMEEILSTPYRISWKNGIAEVTHPLFRTMFSSDIDGWTLSFTAAAENVRPANERHSYFWTDNGFLTYFDMESAHNLILNQLMGLRVLSLADLGAGNGLLAAKAAKILGAGAWAIDQDPDKCTRGSEAFDNIHFKCMKIAAFDLTAEMVIVSVSRLQEGGITTDKLEQLASKYIVLYSYDKDIVKDHIFKAFRRIGSVNRRVHVYGKSV